MCVPTLVGAFLLEEKCVCAREGVCGFHNKLVPRLS